MARYFIIGLSLMWMMVFYQNCSPHAQAAAKISERSATHQFTQSK